MKSKQTEKADSANAVSTTTDDIQNHSDMTEVERVADMNTRACANTMTTNNFDAHDNNNRIELDYGDGHIQNTKNAYTFDNAESCYPGRLFHCSVRAAAPNKRAQDETTVRKSEFTFHSDGLSLSQTVQPDNVLAVATICSACVEATSSRLAHQRTSGKMPLLHFCKHLNSSYSTRGWLLSETGLNGRTTHFTYDALGRVIREDRSDVTRVATEDVYDDSQSVTNPRSESSATSKYRMTTTGSVAPPSNTRYNRVGRAIRARTVGFDGQPLYQDTEYNNFGVADQTLKRVYVTPSAGGVNLFEHRYEFDSIGNITRRSDEVQGLVEAMACDQLSRLVFASVTEAGTVNISYHNAGNLSHRTPTSDLGNVGAYVSGIRLSRKNNPKRWCTPAYKTLEKE